MASLAESSVASVSVAQLIQLQEQLLKAQQHDPSASDRPETGPDAPKATTISHDPSPHALDLTTAPHANSVVPTRTTDSAHTHHTAQTSPQSRRHRPRLSSSKSAPEAEMDAMLQASPSQEASTPWTKGISFHGFAGGDTQIMPSQVYRQHTEAVAKAANKTPVKGASATQDGRVETNNTVMTDRTPGTLAEGNSGFVDLAHAFKPASPSGNSVSDYDELLASPQTQLHAPDAARTILPETPAVAGRKRSRSGEVIVSDPPTTTTKTPGFSQFFGGGRGNVMSATQLFNQTQAPSSPVPDVPRSDPIVSRPSPNMHFPRSSPTAISSSPAVNMHPRPATASGEPRDTYTSMRESQERRAARLRQELGLKEVLEEEDDEDDEDDPERRRQENRRLQRVMSEQARESWDKVRAPTRAGSRLSSRWKPRATIDLVTPLTARKGERVVFDVSDDDAQSEDELLGEESVHGNAGMERDDELALHVLKSQPDGPDHEGEAEVEDEEDGANALLVGKDDGMDHAAGDDHENPSTDAVIARSSLQQDAGKPNQPRTANLAAATQQSAVANSLPATQELHRSLLRRNSEGPSSMVYFVPGSQYAGITSQEQDQAVKHQQQATADHRQSPMTTARVSSSHSKVPSSPPVMDKDSAIPDDSPELSVARRQILAQPRRRRLSLSGENVPPLLEVPESDSIEQATSPHRDDQPQTESNGQQLYSTARSRLSNSGPSPARLSAMLSPAKMSLSQRSKVTEPSPRREAGILRFEDIANDSMVPAASGESFVDVDAIMGNVLTAEDRQVIEAISSPVRAPASKRRRIALELSTDVQSVARANSDRPASISEGVEADVDPLVDETVIGVETEHQSSVQALQDNESTANEMPASTPTDAKVTVNEAPDSVRQRELAGAQVVSQLLSKRAAKPRKLVTYKSAAATDRLSKKKDSTKKKKKKAGRKPIDVEVARELSAAAPPKEQGVQSVQADPQPNEDTVPADVIPPGENEEQLKTTAQVDQQTAISACDRVLALFKGSYNNFYPATWLSSSLDGTSYKVKFDDTTITNVDAQHVRRLELQLGDQIKVDVNGMRNKTWVVKGLGNVATDERQRIDGIDTFGHRTVKVQAKGGRDSLTASDMLEDGEGPLIDVVVPAIYMTHSMWVKFNRPFSAPSTGRPNMLRVGTPVTDIQTPAVETPSSRSRRSNIGVARAMSLQTSHSNLRESSVTPSVNKTSTGVFTGMAFAISYGSNEAEKAEVTRLITRNGGLILENGFDELFTLPSLDHPNATSPVKRSVGKAKRSAGQGDPVLSLRKEYSDLGFVALIADRHSRRAKYMQALALGLPTLSGKWVKDSVSKTNENKNATPLPWPQYLLPAGESTYLNGAVRSRTLHLPVPSEVKLDNMVRDREVLLNGEGVLIVTAKKGKGTWERRKAYAFLTLALGAGNVKRLNDLHEAETHVGKEPEKWKWVYVDGSVAEASAAFFGKGSGKSDGSSKKRKRESDSFVGSVNAKAMSASDGKVRIVNDEFVVQSLILGALVD